LNEISLSLKERTFFIMTASGEDSDLSKLEITSQDASLVFHFYGNWSLTGKRKTPKKIILLSGCKVRLDCSELKSWDSLFLTVVLLIRKQVQRVSGTFSEEGLPTGVRKMLALAEQGDPLIEQKVSAKNSGIFYAKFSALLSHLWDQCSFFGEVLLSLLRFFCGVSITRKIDILHQTLNCGPSALGIISLISFLMGMILAFLGAIPLKMFNAEIFITGLLGIGILRLIGPLMVGIVMAGRTGSSFAAELGTMQVNEELDAMKTFGISQVEFLIVPRCLALMIMVPLLGIYADVVGILGGMVVGVFYMDLNCVEFMDELWELTRLSDLYVGLFTCFVFGFLVSLYGCFHGIHCGRDAGAVGTAVTSAVVNSIVAIVVATAIITIISVHLKI